MLPKAGREGGIIKSSSPGVLSGYKDCTDVKCDASATVMINCKLEVSSAALQINKDTMLSGVRIDCDVNPSCLELKDGATLTIDSAMITCDNKGRFIQIDGASTLTMSSVEAFHCGTDDLNGGVVKKYSADDAVVQISTSLFHHNKAKWGGAVHMGSGGHGELVVSKSTFHSNKVTGSGGCIHVGSIGKIEITESHFRDNRAKAHGGVISKGTTPLIITDSKFKGNRAQLGAIFYTSYNATTTFTSCSMEDNVGYQGNALYCNKPDIAVTLLYTYIESKAIHHCNVDF